MALEVVSALCHEHYSGQLQDPTLNPQGESGRRTDAGPTLAVFPCELIASDSLISNSLFRLRGALMGYLCAA